MRKKITLFIFLLIASINIALAQNTAVKGKVVDNTGQALPGVTVTIKGTTTGALTDVSGNYTVSVPPNSTLVFSFVGFSSKSVVVGNQTSINVKLEELHNDLNEVVVVGYGTQKKSVVTGAISGVKAADLEKQPVNRIEQALQGRTSGLTIAAASGSPGANSSVRLRGMTSFVNNKNNPLWVVDGVVVDNGGIGYLNQSDIESIEVLKDAASAAIYGARSAAGVILVTTKRGKAGTVTVNYSGYYGTQKPAKKLDMLNATQYATARNQALTNVGKAPLYTDPASFGVGTDWQSLIFNNSAPKQNHEVSISGGNEKSTFYTSFGYNTIDGIVATPISKWKRLNIRLNSTHKIKPWLTFGENMGYSHSVTNGIGPTNREFGGPLSSAINLDPITPAIVTDPALAAAYQARNDARFVKDPQGRFYGIPNFDGKTGAFQEMTNPLAYIQNRIGNNDWDHNAVGNAFLEAEPIKGLRVRSSLGVKLSFYGGDSFTPIAYYSSSQVNARSTFARNQNNTLSYNIENTISYNKKFDKHDVTLLFGQGSYLDGRLKGVSTTFFDVPATDFKSASFRYKPIPANRTTDATDGTDKKVQSLFSRVQYNYDEKYLLTALVRRDGSSHFGDNNKFGYFPSVGLGWVPTRESFFPTTNVINNLKIRGSYGVTGNDIFESGVDDFSYISQVGAGRNYPFGTGENISVGYSPNAIGNPDLKWEQTTQTDVGIDATLFNNLTISADWYKKKTTGILQVVQLPGYVGYGSPVQNAASMENNGWEFEAGYRNKIGKVDFGVNGNISFVKNKVTKLLPGRDFIEDLAGSFQTLGNITRTQLGGAYNQFYGYKNLGLFQTQAEIDNYKSQSGKVLQPNAKPGDIKFANLNNDDQINQDDRTYIGNPLPTVTYGITVNVGYAGFDLVAFGSGAGGNQIFQGLRRLDIGAANYQTKILNAWTPSNTNTSVPRLADGDPNKNYSNFSSVYLESGNYFRLRTLQLGYTFDKNTVKKLGLQKLRVYVLSENLFTVTKYSGFDPELGISNDAGGGGAFSIDRGFYPQARTFLFGLQVSL